MAGERAPCCVCLQSRSHGSVPPPCRDNVVTVGDESQDYQRWHGGEIDGLLE